MISGTFHLYLIVVSQGGDLQLLVSVSEDLVTLASENVKLFRNKKIY